jgi:hypothetical protein
VSKPTFVDVSATCAVAVEGYRWQADPAWDAGAPAGTLAEAGVRSTVAARWGELAKKEGWAPKAVKAAPPKAGSSKANKAAAAAAEAGASPHAAGGEATGGLRVSGRANTPRWVLRGSARVWGCHQLSEGSSTHS